MARGVFVLAGKDPARVNNVSTEQYYAFHSSPIAPRPSNSVLDLSKIESTGFTPAPADELLVPYVEKYLARPAQE